MGSTQTSVAAPDSRFNPAFQNRMPQSGSRFSFAPETPIHLQRSTFAPTSPTDSDIDTSTMSSFGTHLHPISRSISVIVEEQKRQEQQEATARRLRPNPTISEGHIQEEIDAQANAMSGSGSGIDKSLPMVPAHPQLRIQTRSPRQERIPENLNGPAMPPSYSQPAVELPASQPAFVRDDQKSSCGGGIDYDVAQTECLLPPRKPPTMVYSPHSFSRQDMLSFEPTYEQQSFPEPPSSRPFESSFCGANSTCCLAFVCPCIVYGRTQYRLNQKSSGKAITDLLGYETANGSCLLMSLSCCFSGILATIQRIRVRKAYAIPGGAADDFLKSCCCCCCVLAQNENEILRRAKPSNDSRTAYVSPAGMAYPLPPRA